MGNTEQREAEAHAQSKDPVDDGLQEQIPADARAGLVERGRDAADPARARETDDSVPELLSFEQHEDGQDHHEATGGEGVEKGAERRGKAPEVGGRIDGLDRDRFLGDGGRGVALHGLLDVLDRLLHLLDRAAAARPPEIGNPLTNRVTIAGQLVGEGPQLARHTPSDPTYHRERQDDGEKHGRNPSEVTLKEDHDGSEQKGEEGGQGDRHEDRLTEVEHGDH